jgi:phosphoglycolate phosphatase-like HAD superfamily hydrolase
MIRHVAFDFDGTLVRSNAIKRECFYEVSAGMEGAAAVLDRLIAQDFRGDRFAVLRELARRIGAAYGEAPDPEVLADNYGRLCRRRIAAAPEIPGARATLERLTAEGVRLFLVSATPQRPLEQIVADRDLCRFFARILGGPTDKATHLRQIMADCGITTNQLALVGDGSDDREAAVAVGCSLFPVTGGTVAETAEGLSAMSDLRQLLPLLGLPPAQSGSALVEGGIQP